MVDHEHNEEFGWFGQTPNENDSEKRPMLFHLLEPIASFQKRGGAKIIAVLEGYKPEDIANHLPLYVPSEFFNAVNVHYVPDVELPQSTEEMRKYIAICWYHMRQIAFHRQPFLIVINPYYSVFKNGVRDMWNAYIGNTIMGDHYLFLVKQLVRMMNYRYVMPILIVNPAEPYVDAVAELHKVYQREYSIPQVMPSVSPYKALSLATTALYEVFGTIQKKKRSQKRKS